MYNKYKIKQSRIGSAHTDVSRIYSTIFKFLQEDHIIQLITTGYHLNGLQGNTLITVALCIQAKYKTGKPRYVNILLPTQKIRFAFFIRKYVNVV